MQYFPKHYYSSANLSAASQTSLLVPPMQVRIDNTSLESFSDITINLATASDWDAVSPTDYTVAATRAGLDFYIYACIPTIGRTPHILLSANATYPSGYDATSSRKVGGFHCLCLNVGTIANHTLTGYLTGAIIPNSVWCLNHRAANHNNVGMVFDEYDQPWKAIYLPSLSGSNAVSVFGGTISDTVTWFNSVDYCANSGTRLLRDDEFTSMATGTPEAVNIYGSADPVTTGGHVSTASVRLISHIGCEDCAGVLWQWLDEQSYRFDAAAAHTHSVTVTDLGVQATSANASADVAPAWAWKAQTGGKGSLYTQGTYGTAKLLAGGNWNSSSSSGTLCRDVSLHPWIASSTGSYRFCCPTVEK